jgi:hypothetical protein
MGWWWEWWTKPTERRSTWFSCGFQDTPGSREMKKAALQELQNRCRRLEKLDKGETRRNKTSRMDIIWQPDGNSEMNIKKNNGAQALTRKDQVIISRLRMGYTRLTHGYREYLNPSPECGDCGARLTVDHLPWDCSTFRRQRIECNISKETLSGDEDEIRRLIRYVHRIGVHHDIWDEFKKDPEHQKTIMANGKTDRMGTRKILENTQSMKRKTKMDTREIIGRIYRNKWNVNDIKKYADIKLTTLGIL